MLLSAFKTQQHIVDAVPDCVKKAIGAGVGMFIAFCGFQSAGLIQKSDSTLVTVGDLSNPGTVLALAGIAITAVLVIRQVKGGTFQRKASWRTRRPARYRQQRIRLP